MVLKKISTRTNTDEHGFIRGENYRVQLYPQDEVVIGNYIGMGRAQGWPDTNVFRSGDYYILVRDDSVKIDGGTITHNERCSFSVIRSPVNFVKGLGKSFRLRSLIEELEATDNE
ncbi:MAG: hypothetical protein V1889_02465 [archaeon]